MSQESKDISRIYRTIEKGIKRGSKNGFKSKAKSGKPIYLVPIEEAKELLQNATPGKTVEL